MKKWEYKHVVVPDSDYDNTLEPLNKAGEEGWEFTGRVEDTGFSNNYLMKREVNVRGSDAPKPLKPAGDDPRTGGLFHNHDISKACGISCPHWHADV